MKPYVAGLRARGVEAHALRLPKGNAERATVVLREQVGANLAGSVIGGHSYGGRVASMVAADSKPAGLVLLSYPLHRPGHPDALRVDHWPQIECPVLLLSGDRDQFARIDLLEQSARSLGRVELHVYPGLRHGLLTVAEDVADRIAAFVKGLRSVTG
jgi:predicted alpha/beta-hydrolase family hydrolase